MKAADHEAIGSALWESLQTRHSAKTALEVSEACRDIGAVLARICGAARGMPSTGMRRGRPPAHDRAWAAATLRSMAGTDNLFEKQESLAADLRQAFIESGRSAPSRSWLRAVVRDCQSAELIRLLEEREQSELQTITNPDSVAA